MHQSIRAWLLALIVMPFLAGECAADDRVVLEPVADPELARLLERRFALPLLLDLSDQTEVGRNQAVGAEAQRLEGVLKALGYLDAVVAVRAKRSEGESLTIRPEPGRLYRIGWIRVDGLARPGSDDLRGRLNAVIAAHTGNAATKDAIEALRSAIRWELREASHAHARIDDGAIVREPETRTVGVQVYVTPGDPVRFGRVHFKGSLRAERKELEANVAFRPGDAYRASALAFLHDALEETGLFRRIRINLKDQPDEAGLSDVTVELRDRPPNPERLAASVGTGPLVLVATMLMLVFREYAGAFGGVWSARLRRGLTSAALVMVATSCVFLAQRVVGFLN